jgi:hypothetical protein
MPKNPLSGRIWPNGSAEIWPRAMRCTPQPPGPDANPIAVDIDRPQSEIIKSIFGVLYLAARKPR